MKIQIKIALLFTLVCTLIMVCLSIAIYHFANEKGFSDFYTRLELRAGIAAKVNLDSAAQTKDAYARIRNEHLRVLPDEREYIIRLDTLRRFAADSVGKALPNSFYTDVVKAKHASYRKGYRFYKGMYYQKGKDAYIVIMSAEHGYARNFLVNLRAILITANLISTIVIFTIGLLFSRQILAPIRKITSEVNNINATLLHRRLAIRDDNDEITELVNTFNNMLSRLETAFETQNNFVSNASHELNTPLAVIIGEAEYALARPREAEQYRQGLQTILSQGEKLKNMAKSLLELAQSSFTSTLSLELVEVHELLHNVIKVATSIYPDCNLVYDDSLQPDTRMITISGNFHLLELCISNIVLNACKYSNGREVKLALATTDRQVLIIVKDQGIGIPAGDMPYIFAPFFRATNAKRATGYGIGLPLAQNIIRLHQGEIQVSSKETEGTEVVIKIPR